MRADQLQGVHAQRLRGVADGHLQDAAQDADWLVVWDPQLLHVVQQRELTRGLQDCDQRSHLQR